MMATDANRTVGYGDLQQARSRATRWMMINACVALAELGLSVGTYMSAAANKEGGTYFVFWGAVVFGAWYTVGHAVRRHRLGSAMEEWRRLARQQAAAVRPASGSRAGTYPPRVASRSSPAQDFRGINLRGQPAQAPVTQRWQVTVASNSGEVSVNDEGLRIAVGERVRSLSWRDVIAVTQQHALSAWLANGMVAHSAWHFLARLTVVRSASWFKREFRGPWQRINRPVPDGIRLRMVKAQNSGGRVPGGALAGPECLPGCLRLRPGV